MATVAIVIQSKRDPKQMSRYRAGPELVGG